MHLIIGSDLYGLEVVAVEWTALNWKVLEKNEYRRKIEWRRYGTEIVFWKTRG